MKKMLLPLGDLPSPLTIHTDALDAPQLLQSKDADQGGEGEAEGADAGEAEVGLFDEVLEVHAVEAGDEGARADAKGADAEFEVEKHEGVAVCVEDGFHAVFWGVGGSRLERGCFVIFDNFCRIANDKGGWGRF